MTFEWYNISEQCTKDAQQGCQLKKQEPEWEARLLTCTRTVCSRSQSWVNLILYSLSFEDWIASHHEQLRLLVRASSLLLRHPPLFRLTLRSVRRQLRLGRRQAKQLLPFRTVPSTHDIRILHPVLLDFGAWGPHRKENPVALVRLSGWGARPTACA